MSDDSGTTMSSADEIARMMTDPATCDVLSEDWLKDSIDSLLAEVRALRKENARLRQPFGFTKEMLDALDAAIADQRVIGERAVGLHRSSAPRILAVLESLRTVVLVRSPFS